MATNTPNLSLAKPAGTDTVDIGVINANMDLIDAAVVAKANAAETNAKAYADTKDTAHLAVAATESVKGHVELATATETTAGTDSTRAVHPAGLKVELDKKAAQSDITTHLAVAATESIKGHVELATTAETTAGTDSTRAVHPAGLKVELDKKAAQSDITTHLGIASSESVAGHVELATAAETTAGTDTTRAVHPAGLKVELDKKISHSLATALSDFLVASGAGLFVQKTLAEVKTILGLGTAAYTSSTNYATSAQGTLATNAVPVSQKAASYGVATLDSAAKLPITQLPVIPTANLTNVAVALGSSALVWELLATYTSTVDNVANFTFSAIPAGYSVLRVTGNIRGYDSQTRTFSVGNFNGDSDYDNYYGGWIKNGVFTQGSNNSSALDFPGGLDGRTFVDIIITNDNTSEIVAGGRCFNGSFFVDANAEYRGVALITSMRVTGNGFKTGSQIKLFGSKSF